jgi:hypothetical protein
MLMLGIFIGDPVTNFVDVDQLQSDIEQGRFGQHPVDPIDNSSNPLDNRDIQYQSPLWLEEFVKTFWKLGSNMATGMSFYDGSSKYSYGMS